MVAVVRGDGRDNRLVREEGKFAYYLKRWMLVCVLCAAPSFALAMDAKEPFQPLAMIMGVVIFILIYTVICCSKWYVKVTRFPTMYKALRWSFMIKIVLAIVALPFSLLGVTRNVDIGMTVMFPDFISGMYAIILYLAASRGSENLHSTDKIDYGFFDTLCITLIEGGILSVMIVIFALLLLLVLKIIAFIQGIRAEKSAV